MLWRVCGLVVLAATSVAGRALGQEQHAHSSADRLGEVSFPVSCLPQVQKTFERGVALLHSFAYAAAEKQFAEVSAADPKCAMAHWGVAIAYYRQLWEPRIAAADVERGQKEIEQAQRLGGGSEREVGFIEALAEFYRDAGKASQEKCASAYTDAMGKVASRQPPDNEAKIFYALALLSTASPSDRGRGNQKRAAAILEPGFQQYPQHPGAAHYLIHAYDNPEMAKMGLPHGDFKVGYAAAAMPARYAVEQRKWADAAALAPREGDLPQTLAVTHWARAVGMARSEQTAGAAREIEKLLECLEKLGGAKDVYWAAQVEIQIDEAKAWVAAAAGRHDEALALAHSAADREDALEKRPVTPGPIVPAREQLADLLLEAKKPSEALAEFENALKDAPGRREALAGRARAAELAGEQDKAKRLKTEFGGVKTGR